MRPLSSCKGVALAAVMLHLGLMSRCLVEAQMDTIDVMLKLQVTQDDGGVAVQAVPQQGGKQGLRGFQGGVDPRGLQALDPLVANPNQVLFAPGDGIPPPDPLQQLQPTGVFPPADLDFGTAAIQFPGTAQQGTAAALDGGAFPNFNIAQQQAAALAPCISFNSAALHAPPSPPATPAQGKACFHRVLSVFRQHPPFPSPPKHAKACFNRALSVFRANWRPEVTGPALRASFHDCGTYVASPVKTAATYNVPLDGSGLKTGAMTVPLRCGGCNGSIKQEFELGKLSGWQVFGEQNGMQLWYDFLFAKRERASDASATTTLADLIRAKEGSAYDCRAMSNADIISLLGLYAVKRAGGTPLRGCPWLPGRADAPRDHYDDTSLLPSEASDAAALKAQAREMYVF
ncbi:hypothetical protein JKP88DRAFT_242791 [Tribonema minus]|uniref:Plant heme peroxidase family profile domain-containing protein n=1 Tax=Tribonema minus TaxID=303371 RepID=A0A835ZDZ6_9STRA|nr:hypothetical protein JKP88DRAFT_242791 [Tribonema minus]